MQTCLHLDSALPGDEVNKPSLMDQIITAAGLNYYYQKREKTMGETSVMKIPVNGMNLAIPQEMVERWHQDLRTIIKLHEDNGRLQLLLYETQDKLRNAQNTRGMSARERELASQLELAEEHNRELVQSLREMAEKVSTRQSSSPQQEEESKLNRELKETIRCLQENLREETIDRKKVQTERDNLERINSNIKTTLTQCQNNLTARNEEVSRLKETISGWEKKFNYLEGSYSILDKDKTKGINDLLNVTRDRDRLQKMTEGMTASLNDLQRQNRELTEALNRLREDKRETKCQPHCCQQSIELHKDNQRLQREWSHMNSSLADNRRSCDEYESSLTELNNKIHDLSNEVTRLKEGRFTEEEFQALCHQFPKMAGCRFHEEDCQRFCKGCLNYWVNLFGKDKLTPVLIDAAKEIMNKAQLRWLHRDHGQLVTQDDPSVDRAFAEDVVASLFELYCYNSEPVKCVKPGEVGRVKIDSALILL